VRRGWCPRGGRSGCRGPCWQVVPCRPGRCRYHERRPVAAELRRPIGPGGSSGLPSRPHEGSSHGQYRTPVRYVNDPSVTGPVMRSRVRQRAIEIARLVPILNLTHYQRSNVSLRSIVSLRHGSSTDERDRSPSLRILSSGESITRNLCGERVWDRHSPPSDTRVRRRRPRPNGFVPAAHRTEPLPRHHRVTPER